MVTTPTRQRTGSAADRNKGITTAMQWEIFSEEGRPLLWSHLVSVGLGLSFLIAALFGPRPITDAGAFREVHGFKVSVDMGGMIPESVFPSTSRSGSGRDGGTAGKRWTTKSDSRAQGGQSSIAAAFRAAAGLAPSGMAGGGADVFRGVQTNSGTGYNGLARIGGEQGGKAALTYGDGSGSGGSGRVGIGGGNASGGSGAGIGRVNGGTGVTRSIVTVSAPSVVAEKPGAPGRDVSNLGTIVRDRQAMLQSCYTQRGLSVNPKLAGTVDVAITLNAVGGVTRVTAIPRSMSGPGTAQVMSCIEATIGRWAFPSSEAGTGTYSFPFSFTS